MTIAVGDRLPDVQVQTPSDDGPKPARTGDLLGSGKVVLVGVPAAFSPTCSDYHLPGFSLRAKDLKEKGVSRIACVSVNDAYVMGAWARDLDVEDVVMVADGLGELTKAMGLEVDLAGGGLGIRSKRYAAIFQDGVLEDLAVEPDLGLEVSSADAVLAKL